MAKRIIMIPPFEVLTGNLSGKQDLQYAENNNPAFEAPNGNQGARNYTTRYVGAKRSDGKTYYAVRRKNTAVLNTSTRLQMALFGGAAAMIASIITTPSQLAQVEAVYALAKKAGSTEAKSLRAFLQEKLTPGLAGKMAIISISAYLGEESATFFARNPWVYTSQTGGVEVKVGNNVLVKFWMQLASYPIVFTIAGMKGVAHGAASPAEADDFSDVVGGKYNVLDLSLDATQGGFSRLMLGNMYVTFEDNSETFSAVGERSVSKQAGSSSNTLAYSLSDTAAPIWED